MGGRLFVQAKMRATCAYAADRAEAAPVAEAMQAAGVLAGVCGGGRDAGAG